MLNDWFLNPVLGRKGEKKGEQVDWLIYLGYNITAFHTIQISLGENAQVGEAYFYHIVPGSHKWPTGRSEAVPTACPAGSVIYFLGLW